MSSMWVQESFLDEGFILDKRIGVGQPKRIENAKILVANTAMDTDKIKIYGARVRVDSMAKVCFPDGHLPVYEHTYASTYFITVPLLSADVSKVAVIVLVLLSIEGLNAMRRCK